MQKVVSVNIGLRKGLADSGGIKELEIPTLDKYLQEGYRVINSFSTTSNAEV